MNYIRRGQKPRDLFSTLLSAHEIWESTQKYHAEKLPRVSCVGEFCNLCKSHDLLARCAVTPVRNFLCKNWSIIVGIDKQIKVWLVYWFFERHLPWNQLALDESAVAETLKTPNIIPLMFVTENKATFLFSCLVSAFSGTKFAELGAGGGERRVAGDRRQDCDPRELGREDWVGQWSIIIWQWTLISRQQPITARLSPRPANQRPRACNPLRAHHRPMMNDRSLIDGLLQTWLHHSTPIHQAPGRRRHRHNSENIRRLIVFTFFKPFFNLRTYF